MHTEYIVSSRNLDKKLPLPLLKVISMILSCISFCVFFHVDKNLYDLS